MFAISSDILSSLQIAHFFYKDDEKLIFCTPIAFSVDDWKFYLESPPKSNTIKLFIKINDRLFNYNCLIRQDSEKIYLIHIPFPPLVADKIKSLIAEYDFEQRREKRFIIRNSDDFNLKEDLQKIIIDNKAYLCKIHDVSASGICVLAFDVLTINTEIAVLELAMKNTDNLILLEGVIIRTDYGKHSAKIALRHIQPLNNTFLNELNSLQSSNAF
ncbi:MAG: PilZ domain-containing protein [Treponemataceae bacterium]